MLYIREPFLLDFCCEYIVNFSIAVYYIPTSVSQFCTDKKVSFSQCFPRLLLKAVNIYLLVMLSIYVFLGIIPNRNICGFNSNAIFMFYGCFAFISSTSQSFCITITYGEMLLFYCSISNIYCGIICPFWQSSAELYTIYSNSFSNCSVV